MIEQFRLPDAGEGLTEAEIVSWKVRPGQRVAVNDVIVEIETAKSLVELPSPFAGVVTELLVPEGATVAVGTPIIAVEVAPVGEAAEPNPAATSVSATGTVVVDPGIAETRPLLARAVSEPVAERQSVLVGYGPRTGAASRRRRLRGIGTGQPGGSDADVAANSAKITVRPGSPTTTSQSAVPPPRAKPPVRKLARDLGVDLRHVKPTGAEGVITRADVEAAAQPQPQPQSTATQASNIPYKGLRRATAQAMVASAFTAPHVTEWVDVDLTRTVKLVRRLAATSRFAQVKLSPLAVVAACLVSAVQRNPQVNSSLEVEAEQIVVHSTINLGVATATARGLLVPVIAGAQELDLRQLAQAINDRADLARSGRAQPADLQGGTITITNVGVFGVDGGTPILVPGQAAILALGRIIERPWVHHGKIKPRWVATLALSFDHRIIDGELGSRVLTDIAAGLNEPALLL